MNVLVDTSAWVDFLNGYPSAEKRAVAELLASEHEVSTCGVIVAEVFQGLRKSAGREEVADLFRQMEFLEAEGIDLYLRAAKVFRELRGTGVTIRSTVDCLIAVLAEAHGCHLLARDADMDRLLGSGLLQVQRWPVARDQDLPTEGDAT